MKTYDYCGEGPDNEAFSFLVDEYLETHGLGEDSQGNPRANGYPSYGDMAGADAWATEQMAAR